MNIVSSFRPLAEDEEWKRNQLLAKRSWEMAAQKIVFFGPYEPELASPRTKFVESEQFPKIKTLCDAASKLPGFTAILNADIVVDLEIRSLVNRMSIKGQVSASSRRWHFDPNTCDWGSADLGDDRGRDVFITRWDIWRDLARKLPDELRIGHGLWDAALVNYFRDRYGAKFVDFTSRKLIFHPRHEGRRRPHQPLEAVDVRPFCDPRMWTNQA